MARVTYQKVHEKTNDQSHETQQMEQMWHVKLSKGCCPFSLAAELVLKVSMLTIAASVWTVASTEHAVTATIYNVFILCVYF